MRLIGDIFLTLVMEFFGNSSIISISYNDFIKSLLNGHEKGKLLLFEKQQL